MENKHVEHYYLLVKCSKGDHQAQFELYKLYASLMYNVAYRIMGNRFDAEDALQEAFVKAFMKISSFKGEATFGSWLKRIVVNQCISELRKKKWNMQPLTPKIEEIQNEDCEFEIDEQFPIEKVMLAVESLPNGARLVFVLKAIEEYKFTDISQILGNSESNCKVQYHRAKKLLSEKLKATN